jgi:hypothetical protein
MWAAKDGASTHPRYGEGQKPERKVGHPGYHTSMAKKLRYMANFAAIFSRSDNTHQICTQPIAKFTEGSL